MENQTKKVTIAGLKETHNKEKGKTFATLIVVDYDILNDTEDEIKINLVTKDSSDECYPKDKLQKTFSLLSKQIDKTLTVPEEPTFENIVKVLKPIKDEEITIYHYENNGYEGFSLFESSNSNTNFFEKAESLDVFMKKHNLSVGSTFVAPFRGFYIDTHFNAYDYVKNKSKAVNFLATTREELYNLFLSTLEKDGGDTAKKIIERLKEYKEKSKGKMSTAGIIQRVGVFSAESRNKGDLDFTTINNLKAVIDLSKSSHAKISTIRALFSDNFNSDTKFKTSEMKPNTWFSNTPKNWTLFMMMDDTILLDFKSFTTPMQDYGMIEKEDVEYLRENGSNPYSILEFIQNKLMDNCFVLECEIDEYSNNAFAKVQTLRPATEEEKEKMFSDNTSDEVEELVDTLNSEKDDIDELPTMDIDELENEEETSDSETNEKEDAKTDKKESEKTSDEEEFLDDDDDELWGF